MALEHCNAQVNAQGREIKEHGTRLFPIACYHDRLAQDAVPWHWHDEWEVIVIQQGCAVLSIDGQTHTLNTGEGIFINASALHSVRDQGNTDCCLQSLVFHPRLVGGSLESIFWQSYVQPILSHTGLKCRPLTPAVA